MALHVFPVKSCAGSSLSSSRVSSAGLEFDRQWMVMRGRTVLTQAREPRLAQIKARLELGRRVMVLSCPGLEDIEVTLEVRGETSGLTGGVCLGKVCGEEVEGEDCGEAVSDWLEAALGLSDLRLVRSVRRRSARLSLANDSSCLLVSQASLAQLAREVRERCARLGEDSDQFSEQSLAARFRANILVSADQPFLEETWQHFTAGGSSKCPLLSFHFFTSMSGKI